MSPSRYQPVRDTSKVKNRCNSRGSLYIPFPNLHHGFINYLGQPSNRISLFLSLPLFCYHVDAGFDRFSVYFSDRLNDHEPPNFLVSDSSDLTDLLAVMLECFICIDSFEPRTPVGGREFQQDSIFLVPRLLQQCQVQCVMLRVQNC